MKRSVTLVMSKIDGMTVFNTEEVNTKKQPMFFGKPLGVQGHTQKLNTLLNELSNVNEEECESCAV